eukprot:NODE_29_length_33183_cov_0.333666.p10 type:complete len:257 gc:universal NODE_29_length_33183_cov_0.333666:3708-2938(-)
MAISEHFQIVAIFLCISYLQLISGALFAVYTIKKRGAIFWFSIFCLLCCSIHSTVKFILDNEVATLTAALISKLTLFLLYSLYVERLNSLGKHIRVRYDRLIKFMPIIVVLLQVAPAADFMLSSDGIFRWGKFGFVTTIVSFLLLLAETYCFFILRSKMLLMLELRHTLKTALIKQVRVAYIVTVIGDLSAIVITFIDPLLGITLTYFLISIKVVFVLDYFRHVILEMIQENDSGISLQIIEFRDTERPLEITVGK